MRRSPVALAAALALAVLAGGALAAAGGLTGFLLRSGEQTGFHLHGRPVTQTTITAFVNFGGGTRKERQTETAQLTKEGFVLASNEQLSASGGRAGFSLAMEFTSPTGASAAAGDLLKTAIQGQKGSKLSRFRVKGVPSARGVLARGGTVDTANVYWTEGSCAFGSGDYIPSGAGPVTAPVITGAQKLNRRTRGTCP